MIAPWMVIVLSILACLPAVIASSKGRSFAAWWFFGFLLLVPALIAALVIRPDASVIEKRRLQSGQARRCPWCAEVVRAEAVACRSCGRDIDRASTTLTHAGAPVEAKSQGVPPDSTAHDAHAPHYYGGQAVIEGVMMRGAKTWAIAVRRPDGQIYLERHAVSDFPQRHPLFTKPMFRGMFGLVDALTIGTKALTISANQSVEEEEQLSSKAMGGSLIFALLLFIGVFIVLPNAGLAFLSRSIGDGWLYHVVEGVVRMGIFLVYLSAISLLADIRRVFQYHGAEHMTIAAWEHDEPLEPSAVRKYSTLHVRCGTNFLLMVMLLAIVVYSIGGWLVPAPDGGAVLKAAYHIALRVILLPVVAGLAYEGLRLGAGKDNIVVRALMKPGLWLQMITTKPPTDDQIEVAIRSFEAVVPVEHLEGRVPSALSSPLVWGEDETGPVRDQPADVTGAAITDVPVQDAADEPTSGY